MKWRSGNPARLKLTRRNLLEAADTVSHKLLNPYINAKVFGHHLPGWGRLQLWQWHLCNAYERAMGWMDQEDSAS